MRARTLGAAAAALVALGAGACSKAENIIGLAHVINDDGSDKNNPAGQNPGTITLVLDVLNPSVQIGDTVRVGAVYSASKTNPGAGNDWANLGASDSSIVAVTFVNLNNVQLIARSVGYTSVTAHYLTTFATPVGVTVSAKNGISALVDYDTTSLAWNPPAFHIAAGSSAQFNVTTAHNIVFDAAPGAPANIAVGATGADAIRMFATTDTLHYHCTIHGEAGTIVVTP
jgi:hypothetical protein